MQIILLGSYMQKQFLEIWKTKIVVYHFRSVWRLVEMQSTMDEKGNPLNLDMFGKQMS